MDTGVAVSGRTGGIGRQWGLRRPELDGMRGLAVLLVVVGHAQIPGFIGTGLTAGGVTGVTMFFVLSGYLITGLLLQERDRDGRVNLPAFYRRRALRLFPALAAVIVFWVALGFVIPRKGATLQDGAAAALYYGNWASAAGGDLGALSHVWSLAIEEQFYLAWPFLFVIAMTVARGRLALALISGTGAVTAVVLRFLLWDGGAGLDRVYFGSDTRADAILLGCLLALLLHQRRVPHARPVLATVALICVGALSATSGFVAYVVTPLLVSALTVVAVSSLAGYRRYAGWLSNRWLNYFGVRSYGLYLWHVPIFAMSLGSRAFGPIPWAAQVLILGVVTMCFTEASWRLIERPALRLKRHWERRSAEPTVRTPETP